MLRPENVRAAQDKATRLIALACFPLALSAAGTAAIVGNPILPIFVAAFIMAAIAGLGARLKNANGRALVAFGFIGQAMVITAAFAGHAWQSDSHMIFFALLAISTGMSDRRAILVASAAIAAHHLGLTFALPVLVYPSVDLWPNLFLTIFHAVVVSAEAAALCGAITARDRLDHATVVASKRLIAASAESDAARARADDALTNAEIARDEARRAREVAEAANAEARSEAERAQKADDAAREAALREQTKQAQIAREQSQVVDTLKASLARLAAKDLSGAIEEPFAESYEGLRSDFNSAIDALRDAIMLVARTSERVKADRADIGHAVEELTSQTERQRITLTQTTKAVVDISAKVKVTADGARQADGFMQTTHDAASVAGDVVRDAARTMKEIKDASDRIAKIVTSIEEIAFQTNLLSLNAGIEAARAGAAGRGFAVVAAEVGALARRSSNAAKEINTLAEQSGNHVAEGVTLVEQTLQSLDGITLRIEDMLSTVSEISGAAQEQAAHLSDVESAMRALDELAEGNAQAVLRSKSAEDTLRQSADDLSQAMGDFIIEEAFGAQSAGVGPAGPPPAERRAASA